MVLIDKFTAKCKQCGLPETPTSNTLFHGTKFSLQKAFYIASLIYTNKYKFFQVKELCLDLNLSRVSLSNFSKKVNKAIEMNGKKVKWEKLILTRVPSNPINKRIRV